MYSYGITIHPKKELYFCDEIFIAVHLFFLSIQHAPFYGSIDDALVIMWLLQNSIRSFFAFVFPLSIFSIDLFDRLDVCYYYAAGHIRCSTNLRTITRDCKADRLLVPSPLLLTLLADSDELLLSIILDETKLLVSRRRYCKT